MDNRRKRLIYRANHCGMKENDVLLGKFAEERLESLSEEEVDRFEILLNHTDNDLYNWIIGQEETPELVDSDVLQMIKKFNGTA